MASLMSAAPMCGTALLCLAAAPVLAEAEVITTGSIATLRADELYVSRLAGLDFPSRLSFPVTGVTDGGLTFAGRVDVDHVFRDDTGDTLGDIALHALDRIEVLNGASLGYDVNLRLYHNGEDLETIVSGGLLFEPNPLLRFVVGAPRPVSELFIATRPFVRADAVLESSIFGFYQSDIGGVMDRADPFAVTGVSALYFLPKGTLGASYHDYGEFDETFWSVGGEYQFPTFRVSASLEGGNHIDDPILRAGIAGAVHDRFTYRVDMFHQGGPFENTGIYAQAGYLATPQLEIGLAALCEDFGWDTTSAVGLYGHYDILTGIGGGSRPDDLGLALRASLAETGEGGTIANIGFSFNF